MQQAHPESVNYLDGFAVHWYWDDIAPPSLLDKTHNKFPDKFILNTESCLGTYENGSGQIQISEYFNRRQATNSSWTNPRIMGESRTIC